MKLLYLVLDGAADRVSDEVTAYEMAKKPGLDGLAKQAIAGMMYVIGRGVAPESDTAVLSILGYNPEAYYTGRGPLEALGVGIKIKEGYEVAFRGNFATVKEDGKTILDRRCGRDLPNEEVAELAKAVDNIELGIYDGYARVIPTIGHRAVVIIGSRSYKLSDEITNTDPAYRRRGRLSIAVKEYKPLVSTCKPLTNTSEAIRTAELVNKFTKLCFEILRNHPVNKRRISQNRLQANIILLRDAGARLPTVKPINELYSKEFAAIAEMPVEKGIARLLGMHVFEVPPPSSDKRHDYQLRLEATLRMLEKYDVAYVHLKGPDEPGHDRNLKAKASAIEDIDKYYVQPLMEIIDIEETAVVITSDHATPCSVGTHTDDPVPIILVHGSLKPDGLSKLTEKECFEKGSMGIIPHGWELLPKVFKILKW